MGNSSLTSPTLLPPYPTPAAPGPRLLLQERDRAVLGDVALYRMLTTSHIELLRAGDSDPALRFVSRLTLTRRLKLLVHNRFLKRLRRPAVSGSLEPVYLLDRAGAIALSKHTGDRATVTRLPNGDLEHLLAVNQFRVSLAVACQERPGAVELAEWQPGEKVRFALRRQGAGEKGRTVVVVPDAFLILRAAVPGTTQKQRLFFFLEIGHGTATTRAIAAKCQAYYRYWREGGFARDYNLPAEVGFRVLFVASSPLEIASLRDAMELLSAGRSLFWFAREDTISPQKILDTIWHCGADAGLHRLAP